MTIAADIARHREALMRLVAMLYRASGSGSTTVLSKINRGSILFYLRPMEAATVRLIAVMAHLLTISGYAPRHRKPRGKPSEPIPKGGQGSPVPNFPLFDRRRSEGTGEPRPKYPKHGPRICFFDDTDAVRDPEPARVMRRTDDLVDATRLVNRLKSLQEALGDLDKQAKRLLRLQAKREAAGKAPRSPIRSCKPPGHRAKARWDVDEILRDCHQLARAVIAAPDTS